MASMLIMSRMATLRRALAFSYTTRRLSGSSLPGYWRISQQRTLPYNTGTRTTTPRAFTSTSTCSTPSSVSTLWMGTVDDDDDDARNERTIHSVWNLAGLKKEVARHILRSHKKIGKARTRLTKAQQVVQDLMDKDNATDQELDACPNIELMEYESQQLQQRLLQLNELEQALVGLKDIPKQTVLPESIATLCLTLGVSDTPPARPPRTPKKRGPRTTSPRLPYRKFFTENQTEIRVGKQAQDNDELSTSPQHRDGSDWWMHASGCPGSHVVIRCADEPLNPQVVQDAAALAARQSKCSGSTIKVSMCKCRDVKKPFGAKPGLVQLTGKVQTVAVNMKEAQSRLERLDQTVVVN